MNRHLLQLYKEKNEKAKRYIYICYSFSYAIFQLLKLELKIPDFLSPLKSLKKL